MALLLRILLNTLAVYVAAQITPGIRIDGFATALIVSIVLGILNALVKPVLVLLTLPVNLLTLGLFTLVINAFIVAMASWFVPAFQVEGFLSAVLFSIVLSLVGWFLGLLAV